MLGFSGSVQAVSVVQGKETMRTPEEIEGMLDQFKIELSSSIAQKLNVDYAWASELVEGLLQAASLKVSADYLRAAQMGSKEPNP